MIDQASSYVVHMLAEKPSELVHQEERIIIKLLYNIADVTPTPVQPYRTWMTFYHKLLMCILVCMIPSTAPTQSW